MVVFDVIQERPRATQTSQFEQLIKTLFGRI